MKTKDLKNLKLKTVSELMKLEKDKRLEIIKTKADVAASKEKNSKKVKNMSRDLAQILTVVREKEIMEGDKSLLTRKDIEESIEKAEG